MNRTPIPCYADGRPYAAPRSLAAREPPGLLRAALRPVIDLARSELPWTLFWEVIQRQLRKARFRLGTLRVHRQVLRAFKAFLEARSCSAPNPRIPPSAHQCMPRDVSAELTEEFIHDLVAKDRSASWLATNIGVLRTAFDKIGGLSLTRRLRTPKRPIHMPDILSPGEIHSLIAAAPTARDRLAIGFLYGGGLKVAELCSLRWGDVDWAGPLIRIRNRGGMAPDRRLAIPDSLLPILTRGVKECPPGAFIFPGRAPGRHLSERHAERLVAGAAETAGLIKAVCCMTLRHSYAVARLRAGHNIRDIQESLGHRRIETTLAYERYLATVGITSPAESLNIRLSGSPAKLPLSSAPQSGEGTSGAATSPQPDSPPIRLPTDRRGEVLPDEAGSTLVPRHSAVPSLDLQIDFSTVELPFPDIPGGWRAFMAWFKARLTPRPPDINPPHPPDSG